MTDTSLYFSHISDLLDFLNLPKINTSHFSNSFPFFVSRHFAGKIEKGNKEDPLLKEILPSNEESIIHPSFSKDPVGDFSSVKEPGILQKYEGRALIITHGTCSLHCRFCFRRNYIHSEKRISLDVLNHWLKKNLNIREIILSGGDPLLLEETFFEKLIQTILSHSHIQTIRLHSRIPVTLPEIFLNPEKRFFKILKQIPQKIKGVFVSHVNHPNELDSESAFIFQELHSQGFTLLNQSVLLKGVNHSSNTLAKLSEKLFHQGVLPYYLHLLDKAQGITHFEVDEHEAIQIYQALLKKLPGYLVPKLVREIPGELSKTPLGQNFSF